MAVYINDTFFEDPDARLPIADLAIQRGYAVFDFFRTVQARPLFIDDHLQRFYQSATALGLQPDQSLETLKAILLELIRRSSLSEVGVRLMLTGGNSPDGFHPTKPNLVLSCKPIQPASDTAFEAGIRVMSYEYQRELSHIKSINYQMAIWLQPLLKERGMDEVLYHLDDVVTEFPRANVFAVMPEGTLVTPSKNILAGITRKKVLELARKVMPVEERDVSLAEINQAAEIFLTSTTRRLMPVVQLDGKMIGDGTPGPVTRNLYALFRNLEHETIARQLR